MRFLICVFVVLQSMAVLAQPVEVPTPAQLADKAVRADNGTLVRVVGASFRPDDVVTEGTEIGDVVEVQQVDGHVVCNVVLYARIVNKSEFYGNAELVGTMPDVPGLNFDEGVAGVYLMPGKCAAGICAWNVLLRGEECRKVGSMPHYVASTMKEMWDLPSVRERLLVTDGVCDGEPCEVHPGDSRAIPGRKVRFPHSWAGRWDDLNFRQMIGGKYLERVSPDRLDSEGKVVPRGVGGP